MKNESKLALKDLSEVTETISVGNLFHSSSTKKKNDCLILVLLCLTTSLSLVSYQFGLVRAMTDRCVGRPGL